MPHDEHIVDSDAHFKIDGKTRAVSNAQEIKTMVVQGDYKSERFTFELPKNIDGHDMSQTTTIQIHYINISSSTREQSVGIYEVDDVVTQTSDDKEIIVFSWLLSGNATKYVGSLSFAIRFICFDTNGDVSYTWNTVVYSGISVSATINNGDQVVEEYTDILQSWYSRLFGEAESYLSAFQALEASAKASSTSAEASKIAASQSAEAAANSEKIATDAAKESLGIRTLYSAVRPDLNGNLDPSSDMVVGPSESVSFTSNRNRLSNVTVHGYTIQEGEGDPSPENIREIKNAGMYNKRITINENSGLSLSGTGSIVGTSRRVNLVTPDIPPVAPGATGKVLCSILPTKPSGGGSGTFDTDGLGISVQSDSSVVAINFRVPGCMTIEDYKAWLKNNPLDVVYLSTENTGKFYTGVVVEQGDEYRCEIIELQAPLHEGDMHETNVQSEYDLEYTFDGTEDWTSASSSYQSAFKLLSKTVGFVAGIQASNNYQQRTSGTIYANDGCYVNADTIFITDSSVKSVSDFKALLASKKTANNPVRLFCKSASGGTGKNVRRETHVKKQYVFTGTENIQKSGLSNNSFYVNFDDIAQNGNVGSVICNQAKAFAETDIASSRIWGVSGSTTNQRTFRISSPETTVDAVKSEFAAQYAAGTPFVIEYDSATPEVYVDEPIIVEHPSGTTTVNSESSSNVFVGFKPFQDGGDAETISGHTWQDILSAIDEAIKASSTPS